MRQDFKVYLIREIATNDIKYVGLTRQTLMMRFQSHLTRFKIRRCDYQIELIVDGLHMEAAIELERMLIAQYKLLETGYNKSPGSINGGSNYHSEEQKAKWSQERKGKKVSEEHAAKNRVARLGQKNTLEHRRKIGEKKSIPVMCIETGEIFKSRRMAARILNVCSAKISDVCNGKRNTTGYLHFKNIKQ